MPDLSETGKKIKRIRKQAGLTQEQLAEKVGGTCTNTVISRYERGTVEMGIQTMYDLAQALGVSPEMLVPDRLLHKLPDTSGELISAQKGDIASTENNKSSAPDIDELFSQLDDENREKAKDYLDALLFRQQHTSYLF